MATPLNYTDDQKEEVITAICNSVIEDKISFNQSVSDSNISLVTFYNWIAKNEAFQQLYNYARNIRSDVLFEEIIEIADTTEEGTKTKTTMTGIETTTGDMTDHRRLKIDARKWVVAKMQPKKYGDKMDLTTNGKDLNPNITIEIIDSTDKVRPDAGS